MRSQVSSKGEAVNILRCITSIALLALLCTSRPVHAVAYCALRDPFAALQTMYPEADAHHSIVRIIGPEARDHVAENLPFSLHFNELGKHTLYVVASDGKPIGLIHARSEPYVWGLVEIVWSLNMDLTIRDFQFQRCRSRSCGDLENGQFKRQLIGKSQQQLSRYLTDDGQFLSPDGLSVPMGAEALALSLLRSAIKTVVITGYAWRDDLTEFTRSSESDSPFPSAKTVEELGNLYASVTQGAGARKLFASATAVDRDSVSGYLYRDAEDRPLGYRVSAQLDLGEFSGRYEWTFSADGRVLEVNAAGRWPNAEVYQSFAELAGRRFTAEDQCSSAVELATHELATLLKHGEAI